VFKPYFLSYYNVSNLPESVDGGYGEGHDGGHAPHDEDGDPHDPHDLILAGLPHRGISFKN